MGLAPLERIRGAFLLCLATGDRGLRVYVGYPSGELRTGDGPRLGVQMITHP